ncbi:putative ribonuclease H-like domain-containing protein [Tanacetum coccineum]
MVPRAVLMKSGLVSINTARQNISKTAVLVNTVRQVNIAHSKIVVNAARPMSYLSKTAHSTVKRPIHKNTTFKNSNINQRVNTVRGKKINIARPKAVVNAVIGNNFNAVKASACRQSNGFADPKSSHDDGSKPSSDDVKKVDEDSRKESKCNDLEKEDNVNSTNNVNAAGTDEVNDVGGKTSIELPFDPWKMIAYLTSQEMMKMMEELLQFKLQEVWTLVDLLNGKRAIDSKWVFRNKKDERGVVIRNKVRLIAQGYTQEEGIDYNEVFAPVANIEAIRLFLAYASFKDFVVYQMDVKSAFLYGKIEEEVYVCQPLGFEDPDFPDRVYKVEKALYGLHQAPRAWYETLSTYLLDNGFQRGKIDKTLFIKRHKGDILLMSSMGELTFFLGLQVQQKKDGIFISQDKYVDEILKKFGFTEVKTASTPMETQKPLLKDEDGEEVDVHMYRSMIGSLMYLTSSRPDIMFAVCACARYQVNPKVSHLHAVKRIFRYLKGQPKLGLWYPKDSPFDLVAYTDSDYAGASLDRKSTTGGCQFLGCRLISWQCKKQTVVANSTTEAEYVAASSCCGQVLWIQNQLLDYGYNFMHTKIFIDNNISFQDSTITYQTQFLSTTDRSICNLFDTTMTTLADKSLLSGGDNKPPMLEKHLYDSWKSRMELYMMNRPHGRMILASVEKGPLVWPSITEDGVTRLKEYVELTPAEAIQADCDIKAINIILQGLPTEIYALVSQHRVAKDLWEKIKLLMQGTSLTKQERECKLYDELFHNC